MKFLVRVGLVLSILLGGLYGQAQSPPAQSPAAPGAPAMAAPAQPPALAPAQTGGQPAQNQTGQPDQPYILPALRANLVNLVFTVTDKKGRFITGLQRQNFGLLDDGFRPAEVVGFKQLTNLPLRVGIMLDTSSSIRTRFKFEQDSAIDFFLQVLHQDDRAFVEGFDTQTYIPQDYTANIDLLNQGIRRLRPGGGTALYDALYKTCQNEMLSLRDDVEVRKAIVLVSDGDDNYSHADMSDAIKMCQRAETIVYTISTDTSPSRGKGGDALEAISAATGGQTFFPVRLEDVALGFKNIEEELRSQYSLEYRPANFKQDGSFRSILLRSTDPRYQVRARTGYFAPGIHKVDCSATTPNGKKTKHKKNDPAQAVPAGCDPTAG